MRELSYACHVCGWRGRQEPTSFSDLDEAYCPNCGTMLYPQSWAQTWGLALLLVGGCVGLIFAVVHFL